MSACDPVSIPFTVSAAEYFEKAKSKMAKMNSTFTGDVTGGSFEVNSPLGKVAGTYSISGQVFTVIVTEKPMMLGCGMIEGILKGALS